MTNQDKRPIPVDDKQKGLFLFTILIIICFPVSFWMMCTISKINKIIVWCIYILSIVMPIYVGIRLEQASRYQPLKIKKRLRKNSLLAKMDTLLPICGFLGIIVGRKVFNYFSVSKGVGYEIMLIVTASGLNIIFFFAITLLLGRFIAIKRWDKKYQNNETQA